MNRFLTVLTIVLGLTMLVIIGCAKKQTIKPIVLASLPIVTPTAVPTFEPEEKEIYLVKKGDCLWNIAKPVYMNPFLWPLIYKANRDFIDDPNLIEVDQILRIDRVFELKKIEEARAFSRDFK